MSGVFPDALVMADAGMRGGSRLLMLENSFRYYSSFGCVTVPKGFVTDGASIPRVFWSILGPMGDYFKAAVIHDFLYSSHNEEFDRWESDFIFKEAMFNTNPRVPWYRRGIIHRAVRLFGGPAFKGGPNK